MLDHQVAADRLVTLTLEVPRAKVEVVRRCAWLIGEGGPDARVLEDIANPLTGMSLHEAEALVAKLLR